MAMNTIETRYTQMQRAHEKKYQGAQLYVIIDELADLMTTNKKQVMPLIQRIAQVGRAAGVHLICATQCPLAKVIPTEIKVNFDARVGLRTRSAQDSRNILGFNGCEDLPRYGQAYYINPDSGVKKIVVPMYDKCETWRLINHWSSSAHRKRKDSLKDCLECKENREKFPALFFCLFLYNALFGFLRLFSSLGKEVYADLLQTSFTHISQV